MRRDGETRRPDSRTDQTMRATHAHESNHTSHRSSTTRAVMVRRARSLSSLVASVAGVASLLLLLVVAPSARAAHLEFGVRAGWNSTDIAIEASEFFTDSADYYAFLTRLNADLAPSANGANHFIRASSASQYSSSLSVSRDLLGASSASLDVFRAGLVLRSASPAVESLAAMRRNAIAAAVANMPYQGPDTQDAKDAAEARWTACETLIAVAGRLFCDATEAVTSTVDTGNEDAPIHEPLFDFDRVHPLSSPAGGATTVAVLYADPLLPSFARAHQSFVDRLVAGESLRYALRPVRVSVAGGDAAAEQPLFVPGFGVELAIKNMEYAVLDDSDRAAAALDAGADADKLAAGGASNETNDPVAAELATIKSSLLQEAAATTATSTATDEKANNFADLGYQTAQRVLAARADVRLELLRDLAQDFPTYASGLARTPRNASVYQALALNSPSVPVAPGHPVHRAHLPAAGTNLLDVNGLGIDLGAGGEDLDIFALLTALRREAAAVDEMRKIGLDADSAHRLLALDVGSRAEREAANGQQGGGEVSFLLHVGAESPETQRVLTWLNDIESDARYRGWPQSLQEYLAPAWPNQLRYIRRNAYTGVVLADASTPRGLDFLAQAAFAVRQNAPCRIGFVFYIPPPPTSQSPNGGARWNSDILSKHAAAASAEDDEGWTDLISEEEEDAAAATDAATQDALYGSIQATIAKAFFHLARGGILSTSTGGAVGPSRKQARETALDFLQQLHESNPQRRTSVTVREVERVYIAAAKKGGFNAQVATSAAFKEALADPALDELVRLSSEWSAARAIVPVGDDDAQEDPDPVIVVNGIVYRSTPRRAFRDLLMGAMFAEQHRTTMRVYRGELSDRVRDIHAHLQSRANVFARVNAVVTARAAEMRFVSTLPSLAASARVAYMLAPDEEVAALPTSLTFWLVADWTSVRGLDTAAALLDYLAKGHGDIRSRVAFVHNPSVDDESYAAGRIASVLTHSAAAASLSPARRFDLLRQVVMVSRVFRGDVEKTRRALERLLMTVVDDIEPTLRQEALRAIAATNLAVNEGRGLNPDFAPAYVASLAQRGANVLLLNGRTMRLDGDDEGVFSNGNDLTTLLADIRLASAFTHTNFGLDTLASLVGDGTVLQYEDAAPEEAKSTRAAVTDTQWRSEVLFRACFTLVSRAAAAASRGASSAPFPSYDSGNSLGLIEHAQPTASLRVRAAIDPTSKAAQKLAAVVVALRDLFQPDIRIWLTPRANLTELPIKRFYRLAIETQLRFEPETKTKTDSAGGALIPFGGAVFRHLRTSRVLSTVIFTPESWLVSLEHARDDLDNLRLDELDAAADSEAGGAIVRAQYRLDHLLLFGQALEVSSGASRGAEPPAGLQLMIGSPAMPFVGDTLVMANLGYFQLKASPGAWTLSIAHARHAEIYEIQEEKRDGAAAGKRGTRQLFVRGFSEGFLRLDVQRRPDHETDQLLDSANMKRRGGPTAPKPAQVPSSAGGLWDSVFGSDAESVVPTGASDASRSVVRVGETIHVFSLASGHLYERFLKIMMLSVLGSTSNPVKFWFLANFASPQFIALAPRFARALGCEVEFVTYKWPAWLRRQEEKQRIIWGYKILFLDVLFPLAVERIIYIDADQVVRGDVAELWHMDLQGAPYAYTPFCDSNEETEGFRFWKAGYWRDHLRGKPYHISALYVVDLDQFRLLRAGDSLRGIYDNLSADPASLANLDQDLPNYAQHMVPIHSLPQEWLWCQTWCSMSSLAKAKTIDLCNNPLTKTPKLEVARTLLPEWRTLDQQARDIEDGVERAQDQSKSETATATGHEEL